MQELLAAAFPIIVVGAAILISITTHEFSHGLAAFLRETRLHATKAGSRLTRLRTSTRSARFSCH